MTARLIPLSPAEVATRLKIGRAVLVDVREPDEYARAHIPGALSRPLSSFERAALKIEPSREVVFTCRTGMRTGANCDRLAAAVEGDAYVLEGGLDAWTRQGMPVRENPNAPLEMMRQVQIGAGGLVLIGALLGVLVHPGFLGVPIFVGAGLLMAGITGFCGMARLLALAPWNRAA
ncbi:rhodanese family protein [Caulobacter sp. NIBR2454]|uniref:rhodanese family protein n=1 Tax=Caulobacter sp. NIBR2454 TaxID=3015996 RepID=UPI0022B6DE2D|nr:rhodanese family protein [Caulobacter sp. NIBR2454]